MIMQLPPPAAPQYPGLSLLRLIFFFDFDLFDENELVLDRILISPGESMFPKVLRWE